MRKSPESYGFRAQVCRKMAYRDCRLGGHLGGGGPRGMQRRGDEDHVKVASGTEV